MIFISVLGFVVAQYAASWRIWVVMVLIWTVFYVPAFNEFLEGYGLNVWSNELFPSFYYGVGWGLATQAVVLMFKRQRLVLIRALGSTAKFVFPVLVVFGLWN